MISSIIEISTSNLNQTIPLSPSRISKPRLLSLFAFVIEILVSCNEITSSVDSCLISVASLSCCITSVPGTVGLTERRIIAEDPNDDEDVLALSRMWRIKAGMAGRQPQIIAQVISAYLNAGVLANRDRSVGGSRFVLTTISSAGTIARSRP